MRLGILEGNVYIDFLISGLVEFPAALLILFTIERIGRRLPFATANFVAGAACLITAFIPDSECGRRNVFCFFCHSPNDDTSLFVFLVVKVCCG